MKTVKVRIAVAVDETGDYEVDRVYGDEEPGERAQRLVDDLMLGSNAKPYVITAEIPLPDPLPEPSPVEEIPGTVEES